MMLLARNFFVLAARRPSFCEEQRHDRAGAWSVVVDATLAKLAKKNDGPPKNQTSSPRSQLGNIASAKLPISVTSYL
jgi:hypothetical protein